MPGAKTPLSSSGSGAEQLRNREAFRSNSLAARSNFLAMPSTPGSGLESLGSTKQPAGSLAYRRIGPKDQRHGQGTMTRPGDSLMFCVFGFPAAA